jgi:alpha-tubulin suppressor-like RCC1 family protein
MKQAARGLCVLLGLFLSSSSLARAATVAGGGNHTVIVKPDGTVWAWGANGSGQLGDGTNTLRPVPTAVTGTTSTIVAVAAGSTHTLALGSDGTVWAWGDNSFGQLGDGTPYSRNAPVSLSLTNIIAIAAGNIHSVALQSDGTVWVWGNNSNGQLGNGTTTYSSSPIALTTISGVTAIDAGASHTLAVKSDGTAWAWGYNYYGQLGDGTSNNQRTSPVQMSGVSGATAVAAGGYHSLVLLTDGTVRAVGYNADGELGNNSPTNQNASTVVTVSGLTGVTAIAAGDYHSIARKSDGMNRTGFVGGLIPREDEAHGTSQQVLPGAA